jgi:hypothetical protein
VRRRGCSQRLNRGACERHSGTGDTGEHVCMCARARILATGSSITAGNNMEDYDTAALRARAGAPAPDGASARRHQRPAAQAARRAEPPCTPASPATLERERCNWKGCR